MGELVVLGNPHLVLANIAGDDGVVAGDAGKLTDECGAGNGCQRFLVIGGAKASGGMPGAALFLPGVDGQWLSRNGIG